MIKLQKEQTSDVINVGDGVLCFSQLLFAQLDNNNKLCTTWSHQSV
jgi:hypothetical protein